MANSLYVNKVEYGNQTIIDLTGDTVTAADVRQGVSFHLPSGASGIGTAVNGYTIYMTTTSPEFYGQIITVSQNGSVIGTTSFDNQGNAQYSVDNVGTYTVSVTASGTTVSEEVVVSQIEIELEAGFQYKRWLGYTSLDPDDYASLADVLADEEAVRQLMTRHASVDYLASFTSDDTSVVTILNNDIAAKWITCTAYAEDVLTDAYGALMESIGKYGYGKWVITDSTTTPPTWGALGNVPIMTSNTAPYGEASASSAESSYPVWKVFDDNDATEWDAVSGTTTGYIQYKFNTPICVRRISFLQTNDLRIKNIAVQCSNDGAVFTDIYSAAAEQVTTLQTHTFLNDTYYLYYRFAITNATARVSLKALQFYGRQMSVSVPKMDTNTSPYGVASASSMFNSSTYAYMALDQTNSDSWASVENTNDQWVEYEFPAPVKLCKYYIKPVITITGSSTYTKTAQVSVQGYINDEWVDISGKTLVSNPTSTGTNTTPAEIRGDITSDAEISRVRVNFGEKVGVQRDGIWQFQVWGFDYSEKEWDTEHPRHYIYDHGVELEELTGYKEGSDAFYEKRPYELCTGGVNNYIAEFYAGKIDFTNYSLMRAAFGDELISVYVIRIASVVPYTLTMHANNSNIIATKSVSAGDGSLPNSIGIDISSVNGEYNPIIYIAANTTNATRRGTITELWLE